MCALRVSSLDFSIEISRSFCALLVNDALNQSNEITHLRREVNKGLLVFLGGIKWEHRPARTTFRVTLTEINKILKVTCQTNTYKTNVMAIGF